MGSFNRSYRPSGGNSRFGSNDRGQSRFGDQNARPPMMHKAVCSECGNDCEVPFVPTGNRPIYCSNCFQRNRTGESGGMPPTRRNFDRPSFEPRPVNNTNTNNNGPQLSDQLNDLSAKLDRILMLLSKPENSNTPASGNVSKKSFSEALKINKPNNSNESPKIEAPVEAIKVPKAAKTPKAPKIKSEDLEPVVS